MAASAKTERMSAVLLCRGKFGGNFLLLSLDIAVSREYEDSLFDELGRVSKTSSLSHGFRGTDAQFGVSWNGRDCANPALDRQMPIGSFLGEQCVLAEETNLIWYLLDRSLHHNVSLVKLPKRFERTA